MNGGCDTDTDTMNNNIEINIERWIADLMKDQSVQDYTFEIIGTSEKGDNYIGDIKFVTVKLKDNNKQDYNLVIKHGKSDESARKTLPIRLAFEREIQMYDKVMPFFRNFEKENNVKDPFNAAPKCFKTHLSDNAEFLFLDNLKTKGYQLFDRRYPLTLNHIKLVMEQYGKWHALSFAARDQRNKEIVQLTEGWRQTNLFDRFLSLPDMPNSYQKGYETICRILKENNELKILQKFKDDFEEGSHGILVEIFRTKEPNWVISHGDCWINNYMFNYKNSNASIPTAAAILDWQGSSVTSPVLDLLYFIYATSAGEQLKHLDELLQLYYESLSKHIRALGSDPEKLFPFDEFKRHWNKYIKFPLTFVTLSLQIILATKENSFGIEDLSENDSFAKKIASFKTDKTYETRVLELLKHHYTFKFE